MDLTGYSNFPLGAPRLDNETIDAFAANYRLFKPLERLWPALALTGKTWGVAEPTDPAANHQQVMDLGPWRGTVTFGRPQFGNAPPQGNEYPSGGVAVAEIAPNEYLVAGFHARIEFGAATASKGGDRTVQHVEEGHYDESGGWVIERVWNGDQTDYGLNFTSAPQLLHVKLTTAR